MQVRTVEWDDTGSWPSVLLPRAFPMRLGSCRSTIITRSKNDVAAWEPQLQFARFLKSVLHRIETVTPTYHLVLHTAPNVNAKFEKAGNWNTLASRLSLAF